MPKRYTPHVSKEAKKTVIERSEFDAAMQAVLKAPPLPKTEVSRILKTRAKLDRVLPQTPTRQ
jgi:hypothetical protein